MTTLTGALERIFTWLVNHNPELALSLQPGLTREAMTQALQALPFQLPDEVYELYQWRNGDAQWNYYKDGLLPSYSFLPLQQALEEMASINEYRQSLLAYEADNAVWQKVWFPLFVLDGKEYLFIACDTEPQQSLPVFHLFLESGETFKASSLTTLLLAAADCYETGAYVLKDGYLEEDAQRVAQIYAHYDPEGASTLPVTDYLRRPADQIDLNTPDAFEQLTEALHLPPATPEEAALQYRAAHTLGELAQNLPSGMLESTGDSITINPHHAGEVQPLVPFDQPEGPLARALQNMIYDGAGHQEAARKLGELGDPRGVEPLIEALQHRSSQVRANAAEALGKLGSDRAIEPLIAALQDPDLFVRTQAARSLGSLKADQAIALLLRQLQHGTHPNCRSAAAWALGQIGALEAVEPLIEAASHVHDEYDVRIVSPAATEALAAIETEQTTDALVAILRDREAVLQFPGYAFHTAKQKFEVVIRALLTRQDSRLLDLLTRNLQDPDVTVRNITLGAMVAVQHEALVDLLILSLFDQETSLQLQAIQAFRTWLRPEAVEPLISLLSNPDPTIRAETACTLGHLGHPQAVLPLVKALQDEHHSVRGRAAWALGKLPDPRAIAPLTQCLRDNNEAVRRISQSALQNIDL